MIAAHHHSRRIRRADVVAEARSWIGTPYHHQASRKGAGCDCVGLVRGLWRCFIGPEPGPLPPYSADWSDRTRQDNVDMLIAAARAHLIEIAPEAAGPGDVLLFRWRDNDHARHAGIASGDRHMIHAYQGGAVCESPIGHAWRRRIVAAFRFPGMSD